MIVSTSSVILIRGLPGSGKSTLAKLLAQQGFVHLEADDYFLRPDGSYQFDATKLQEAHRICQKSFSHFMGFGRNIVVSNTFTRKWELQFYLDLCEAHGIRPQIITCEGRFENIHGITEDKIAQMRARWEYL